MNRAGHRTVKMNAADAGSFLKIGARRRRRAAAALPGALARAAALEGGSLLAPLPTHHPAKAQNLIVIFLTGGFSHVDTFDYKPAPDQASRQVGPRVSACAATRPTTARCWARRFGSRRAASRAS